MRAVIYKIITFYEMRAKALTVLVANTQKVLKESERKRKADEQAKRIENFIKDLTMEVNNMLTKFYFRKERKQMISDQTKALVDFVNFVKTLTKNVQSLLSRFQKDKTFEEKIEKEIKELETHVRQKLKEFDEALSETPDTLINRLNKYAGNIAANIRGRLKALALVWQKRKWTRENTSTPPMVDNEINLDVSSSLTKPLAHSVKQDSPTGSTNPRDSEKSERQIHLKV